MYHHVIPDGAGRYAFGCGGCEPRAEPAAGPQAALRGCRYRTLKTAHHDGQGELVFEVSQHHNRGPLKILKELIIA